MTSFAGMGTGFEKRQQGVTGAKNLMGGANLAGGIVSGVGEIGAGIGRLATIQGGPKGSSQQTAANKQRAQAGLDIAAGAAGMAGPIGMAVAAPLKLVSMLLNIKGPRQKRRENREQAEREQRAEFMAKSGAVAARAPLARTIGGGGAQNINNAPAAPTSADFGALAPTSKLLGL